MAFNNKKKKQQLFTEINITPLTDIFLVLLIIMMVVAPSFQSMDNAVDVIALFINGHVHIRFRGEFIAENERFLL